MPKRVLVTAGPVYGKLDANKVVSNRTRGLWAARFAKWLALDRENFKVALLVPDLAEESFRSIMREYQSTYAVEIITHAGYDEYRLKCNKLATWADAMVMGAAVVNWIPKSPFPGKMPTDKQEMDIPFVLAPKVINDIKLLNPRITLIGCKLLFSGHYDELIDAAYDVVLHGKCNAVVANDAKIGLKNKYLVHQDKTVIEFENNFDGLYEALRSIIKDDHYATTVRYPSCNLNLKSKWVFDEIAEKFRDRFIHRGNDGFVFGGIAVHDFHPDEKGKYYFVSPREKGAMFSSEDAVLVTGVDPERNITTSGGKASLNAPLLIRHLEKYPEAAGVVHYHAKENQDPGLRGLLPVAPYAPPGTARDNERSIPGPSYYIKGHGWIIAVDETGTPLSNQC